MRPACRCNQEHLERRIEALEAVVEAVKKERDGFHRMLVEHAGRANRLAELVDDYVTCTEPYMTMPIKACGECPSCKILKALAAYKGEP